MGKNVHAVGHKAGGKIGILIKSGELKEGEKNKHTALPVVTVLVDDFETVTTTTRDELNADSGGGVTRVFAVVMATKESTVASGAEFLHMEEEKKISLAKVLNATVKLALDVEVVTKSVGSDRKAAGIGDKTIS